ncbi:hypothetical protein AMTRI_Chr02g216760 [Amborella trichopoda]|uniref:C3H1-type domain-containing protein n=1 Tax=Amborella trichopoda TaxID=13333 RepID=W1NSN3_AMBTC|nr:zinc finger CCCH domain-containing protein 37 [Amborella trichopoda]ERM97884.1 hypothetical protein AMTR_s00115p00126760 [Amborella trichopoda]|eukprot:XP_006830468.1 zinc finger CCCH domain-containing protein 37 [Amborella trichopoda]
MANQTYSSYGGSSLSSLYSSRLSTNYIADPYSSDASLLGSNRYMGTDTITGSDPSRYSLDKGSAFLNQSDSLRFSGTDTFTASRLSGASLYTQPSRVGGETLGILPNSSVDHSVAGLKRPTEALYHQNVLGTYNTIGQSDSMYSTNSLVKRPRIESASNLPVYPQRPGEKDCTYYMLTRTCKFGDSCKFDHPFWVPEGGIPDWKEVPLIPVSDMLPERPGEPDCPYFMKTQKCKFGQRCKFNHPKDKVEASNVSPSVGNTDGAIITALPERPSEPECTFYMKTGICKFGASCKFHHPKDRPVPLTGTDSVTGEQTGSVKVDGAVVGADQQVKPFTPFTPALLHNSKGLPIRPGEVDCPFYLKTGSCKYGATCRFNHPDWRTTTTPAAVINPLAATLPLGVVNTPPPALSHDPWMAQTTLGLGVSVYPQRPGQIACDYYMKFGECKFGERCKFHHPLDRTAPTAAVAQQVPQQVVKLTLAGLPRREGEAVCPFYMKTATCKYGAVCKFDHPPPGEVAAKAVGGAATDSKIAEGEQVKDE